MDFSGDGNGLFIPKVAKFGTYCAKVTITAKDDLGHEYAGEESIQFSVADKHKEGEPVNYRFGFSTHPRLYFNEPENRKCCQKLLRKPVPVWYAGILRGRKPKKEKKI